MPKEYVYFDSVWKKKFYFPDKKARSNPENNIPLLYLGEKGSELDIAGIEVPTFDQVVRLIAKSETLNDLKAISILEISAKTMNKEQHKRVMEMYNSKHEELVKAQNYQEMSDDNKKKNDAEKIREKYRAAIRAANTKEELKAAFPLNTRIEGLTAEDIKILTSEVFARGRELGANIKDNE